MDTASIKTAFGYARESTDDQLEFSPEAQRKALHVYAEKNGYILDDHNIFSDLGVSGKKADKRPEFQRMIALAKSKAHPCDAILVWKFSRFARNQEESIVYKSMLKRDGVEVISITEPLADGPFGSLIERIIEWMDEYYSIRLAEEVKKGMTEKARRGELQSTPAFGYKVSSNTLIPDPAEADIVREIFSRFNAGDGLYPLARMLNERGIRTHRGNRFENRTIEYIIRNPVYIGKLRWNPSGKTRRRFGDKNLILSDAGHKAIIDSVTWDEAQKRMDRIKAEWGYKARPTTDLKDWPSGIVRCASCGATLVFTLPHYYKCNNFTRGRCTTSQHIRSDLLKDAIIERLSTDLSTELPLSYKIVKKSADESAEAATRARIENLERKKIRLREAYLNGADSAEEYKEWKDAIDRDIERLNATLAEETREIQPAQVNAALRSSIASALETLTAPDATKEQKNEAARSVIENCTYDKSKNLLSITYRAVF